VSISRCRRCQAIRPPNARYCPECGTAFEASPVAWEAPVTSPRSNEGTDVRFSFWTSIKFGAGFAIGASLLSLVLWLFVLFLITLGLSMPSR
jgi:hypothetical protein